METYCPYCMSPAKPGTSCPVCGKDPGSYQPSSHHLPPGRLLYGRYAVGRVLGEGGFGITYLCLDTVLEKRVAIKEYFPTYLVSRETSVSLDVSCFTKGNEPDYEKGRAQFLQEARVMAKLDEIPEIVHVLGYFSENNTAYIVMEYLEGDTLKDLVEREGRIPAKNLFEMLEPVLKAMEAMHSAGIIHRDISPDNLMRLKNGRLKLMDFGCAKDFQGNGTKTVTLKHGFAPKEQYSGMDQGPWTDVYALCATAYYLLTGRVPPWATERRPGDEDPLIPPIKLGAAMTAAQEKALLKGLAIEAKDRFQSAASLYADLYGKTMDFPWRDRDDWKTERKKPEPEKPDPELVPDMGRWRKIILTGAVCAAVLFIAAAALLGKGAGKTVPVHNPSTAVLDGTKKETESEDEPESEKETSGEETGSKKLPGLNLPDGEEEQGEEASAETEAEEATAEPETAAAPPETTAALPETTAAPPETTAAPPETTAAAIPDAESLKSQAEAEAENGRYTAAADLYRQMRGCGYISDSELGELLNDLGWDAYSDEEGSIAENLYQEAIGLGNLEAKYRLATLYWYGGGPEQNKEKAFQLYLETAQAGYGAAVYYKVASCYTEGEGTARDIDQAIYWWNRYLETGSTTFISPDKVREMIAALEAERGGQ